MPDFFAQPGGEKRLTVSEAQEDFKILRRALEERHPGIDRYREPGAFQQALNTAEAQINKPLAVNEFFAVLSPVIDVLDCGHTEIQVPKTEVDALRKTAKLLPFKFGIDKNHLFIRLSYDADTTLGVGLDVIRINGHSTDSLLRAWHGFFSSDGYNETMQNRSGESIFREYYAVFAEQPDSFLLELRNHRSGKESRIRVSHLTYPQLEKRYNARFERNGPPKKLALYFIDSTTAVMNIETFQGKELRKSHAHFRRFVKKSMRELERRHCRRLVIDLRDNTGGNVNLGIFLYRRIAKENFRYIDSATVPTKKPIRFHRYTDKSFLFNLNFLAVKKRDGKCIYRIHHLTKTHKPVSTAFGGEVFVLTNGLTFSNASNFAALVKYQKRGMIVGEEPGGAMNGCSGMTYFNVKLPNSKLVVRIPLAKVIYPFKPYSDYGHGIKPDFEIAGHPNCPVMMGELEFLSPLFYSGKHACPASRKQ
ncbi:MAG: peptidase S41 [Bacteroidetes bacterium]|nr:MAG: peptidase S41 [Bacteroidota bacterium]